jgi:hypothetical protein
MGGKASQSWRPSARKAHGLCNGQLVSATMLAFLKKVGLAIAIQADCSPVE